VRAEELFEDRGAVDSVRCATPLRAEGARIRGYWLTLTRSPREPHLPLVYLFAFVISYSSAVPPSRAHSTSDRHRYTFASRTSLARSPSSRLHRTAFPLLLFKCPSPLSSDPLAPTHRLKTLRARSQPWLTQPIPDAVSLPRT